MVQQLQAYLLGIDFEETAQMIADKVNSAAPDLTNEREELAQIKTKINNGVKAVLGGLNLPELEEELDRLRLSWRTSSSAEPQSVRRSIPPPLSSSSRTQWKTGTQKI